MRIGYFRTALVTTVALVLALSVLSVAFAPLISGVPHHAQVKWYYCGPACLEMVFHFYGPDVDQYEIADAAETDVAIGGTWSSDMLRAAHFSDSSESQGNEMPGSYWGYTARGLGYAAFTHYFTGIDQLKPLIDAGYPIIVLTAGDQDSADDPDGENSWGHYRVVIGYDDAIPEITMQDPLFGANYKLSYTTFGYWWDAWSGRWGLFTQPWNVVLSAPGSVSQGDTFTVSATVTYPCPSPFSTAYPASSSQATIQLPAGLSLAAGETNPKTLDTGTMVAGGSAAVQWDVDADSAGTFAISVEAEGEISPSYTDRIGGASEIGVTVDGVGDGWIEGYVTDALTTVPLDGATVSADSYSDVTDASGFYSIQIPQGTYSATAQMTGYLDQTVAGVPVVADTVTTQDFALTPAPVGASIESSSAVGVKTDEFNPSDTVYVYGSQYPDTEHDYDIYVVADTTWTDGDPFPTPIAGTATTVTSDAAGDIPVTLVWSSPLTPGKYDIVVDVNDNDVYDAGVDALDDSDIEVTAGFLVIPDLLGTIMGLAGCFTALAVFRMSKRKHP